MTLSGFICNVYTFFSLKLIYAVLSTLMLLPKDAILFHCYNYYYYCSYLLAVHLYVLYMFYILEYLITVHQ